MRKKKKSNKTKSVVIKEPLVRLTGNFIPALILNQFIYWSERMYDTDDYIEEENERYIKNGENCVINIDKESLECGWVYKTANELNDELMLDIHRSTLQRKIDGLVDAGYLQRRNNPKYKWDRTYQYRVDMLKIQLDLLKIGYSLDNYKLPSIVLSEQSNVHESPSIAQESPSIALHEQALPEITTENISEITNIDYSCKEKKTEEESIVNPFSSKDDEKKKAKLKNKYTNEEKLVITNICNNLCIERYKDIPEDFSLFTNCILNMTPSSDKKKNNYIYDIVKRIFNDYKWGVIKEAVVTLNRKLEIKDTTWYNLEFFDRRILKVSKPKVIDNDEYNVYICVCGEKIIIDKEESIEKCYKCSTYIDYAELHKNHKIAQAV